MSEKTGPPSSDRPPRGPSRPREGYGGSGPSTNRHPQGPCPGEAAGDQLTESDVVMVQFKGHRKACYHNGRGVALQTGDYCLVEADRGHDMGRVCYVGASKPQWWREAQGQGIIDKATPDQLKHLHENRADEWDDYDICLEKIQLRHLDMQLVSVERQFDRNKITFYFTAEKRVDFRQLVKDLAAMFRTRIELRQIGVRDEAKMKGGLGLCGRELCCSTFMHDFSPVTLKMAKVQQLPLSPNKLSGLCGRLRCCLAYEHQDYVEVLQRMPRVGATVRVGDDSGRVRKVDILREKAYVYFEGDNDMVPVPIADLSWERNQDLPQPRPRNRDGCCKNKH